MPEFSSSDRRGYPMLPARDGYAQWATSYEHTIKDDMDRVVLERIATVQWRGRAADPRLRHLPHA